MRSSQIPPALPDFSPRLLSYAELHLLSPIYKQNIICCIIFTHSVTILYQTSNIKQIFLKHFKPFSLSENICVCSMEICLILKLRLSWRTISCILFSVQSETFPKLMQNMSRFINALETLDSRRAIQAFENKDKANFSCLSLFPHISQYFRKEISMHCRKHSNWILEIQKISFENSNKCTAK